MPSSGVSITVSVDPVSPVPVQSVPAEPQSMPPPVTFPLPEYVTDKLLVPVGGPLKFAVSSYELPSTGTWQVLATAAPGQAVQLSNVQPVPGIAVSVTLPPLPQNAR